MVSGEKLDDVDDDALLYVEGRERVERGRRLIQRTRDRLVRYRPCIMVQTVQTLQTLHLVYWSVLVWYQIPSMVRTLPCSTWMNGIR